MGETMKWVINQPHEGLTLRDFLDYFHVSKKHCYLCEKKQMIKLNGYIPTYNTILHINDVLDIDIEQMQNNTILPFAHPIEVIYEDDDLLLVNKPPFLLVHSDGNTMNTLANRICYYAQTNHIPTPQHVHRLDFETSGILVFAKHFISHSYLSHLFETHGIKKTYVALCSGLFHEKDGIINKPIGKNRHENKQIISSSGKEASTRYRVLSTENNMSRVMVEIIGGRKHQIRIHMQSMGHPIVGDKLYGGRDEKRLMLHFEQIEFLHPRTQQRFIATCKALF